MPIWLEASSGMPLILTCSDQDPPILKKKFPDPGCTLVGGEAPPPKKKIHIFFLQKCSNIFKQNIFSPILFFSKVFKFTRKMRNRLKRKKNQISDFYFSSYGHFSDVIPPIFNEFFTVTQNIKIGEFFYHFFHSIQHTSHHP